MTEDAAPDGDAEVSAKHRIVAGAALVAALAGVAISALDYPSWPGGDARAGSGRPATMPQAPRPVLGAEPASVAPAPPSIAPAAAGPSAAARPRVHQTKRVTRPAETTAMAAATATTAPRSATAAAPIAERVPTIDAQYEATAALQCADGISGVICREAIRWRLCKGRWSDRSQPGASRCFIEGREMTTR